MSKFQTQTDKPIPLKCLVCGGEDFEMTTQRTMKTPWCIPSHGSVTIRYDYNRYTCNNCGFIMNFKIEKYPQRCDK